MSFFRVPGAILAVCLDPAGQRHDTGGFRLSVLAEGRDELRVMQARFDRAAARVAEVGDVRGNRRDDPRYDAGRMALIVDNYAAGERQEHDWSISGTSELTGVRHVLSYSCPFDAAVAREADGSYGAKTWEWC